MSFTEILNEIPTLTLQERQTLLQMLQKQQHLEKARAFAAEFEGITEITIHTPLELIEQRSQHKAYRHEDSILEIWLPDVDAASAKTILQRMNQHKPMYSRFENRWRDK